MASHKLASAYLLLYLLFICPSHASSGDEAAKFNVSSTYDSEKVSLSLYYEALCPYCANFIVNGLTKVINDNEFLSIVNMRLIPWGNTVIGNNKTWVCQHGPDECLLNTVEACAINVWSDLEMHFSFIRCIEHLHLENKHSEWQSCFGTEGLNPKLLVDCFNTGLGFSLYPASGGCFALEKRYAGETARLNPPHEYVPWVVVNNQPLLDDYQNFVAHVCRAYKGPHVPKACRSAPVKINPSLKKNSFDQVCYVSEAKK